MSAPGSRGAGGLGGATFFFLPLRRSTEKGTFPRGGGVGGTAMACLVPSRGRRNRRSLEEQRIEWGNAFLRAVSVSVRGVKVPRGTRLFFFLS